jgi:putative sigma-54 modulation protein
MKVSYRGIQGELPSKIQEKLDVKFAKLSKLLEKRGEKEAHVVITTERHLHHAEITMQFYDHQFVGLGSGADLLAAMSGAIEKLETQAVKQRAKWRAKARRSDSPEPAEKETAPVVKRPGTNHSGAKPGLNLSHKKVHLFRANDHDEHKPMTLEEALMKMEDQRDYVVYRDADKHCLSVLVRRRDGDFDLIES